MRYSSPSSDMLSRDISNEALVAAARDGCHLSYEVLVRRHQTRVFQSAFRILKNVEDAEDATQESFLNALRHLGHFRQDAAFITWITRIAINTSLMQLRKRKRQSGISLDDLSGSEATIAETLIGNDPSPEKQVLATERTRQMYRNIGRLSPRVREITLDYLSTDASVGELARRHGISVAAAKSRLLRARTGLNLRLGPQKSAAHHDNRGTIRAKAAV